MRHTTIFFEGLLIVASMASASASLLTNGDFENSANYLDSWITSGTPNPSLHGGLVAGSTQAVFIPSSGAGDIQNSTLPSPSGDIWRVEMFFATELSGNAGDRGFYTLLEFTGNSSRTNIRVSGDGSLAIYDNSNPSEPDNWEAQLPAGTVKASNAGGNNSFLDPGDTLNLYKLSVFGDFSFSPHYDLTLQEVGGSSYFVSDIARWQNGIPVVGSGIESIRLDTNYSNRSFVVDEVAVLVPEPTASIVLAAFFVLVARRRTRRSLETS